MNADTIWANLLYVNNFLPINRQYLGCLRVRGKALTLEQMHFADEVDPPAGVIPSRLPSVPSRELEMALNLISAFSGKWQPKKYKDTYTEGLRKVVRAKVQGKEVRRAAEPKEEAPPDLMEALRRSLQEDKKPMAARKGASATAARKRA